MTDEQYDELRPAAFAIAYRMLGSVTEAEDMVQEGFLRLHRARAGGERIESPRAYLSTVVSRLSLDHLRSAGVRRETYVGEWLPEPLPGRRRRRSRPQGRDGRLAVATRSSSCSRACRPSSAPRSCCVTCSTSPTTGSRRSSARASRTPASSPRGRAATWRSGAPGSKPRARGARSSRPASSRPPRGAISTGWRSCWPTTSSFRGDGGGKAPGRRARGPWPCQGRAPGAIAGLRNLARLDGVTLQPPGGEWPAGRAVPRPRGAG